MDHVVNLWLFALTVASGAVGWFLRSLWEMVQVLKDDIKQIEVSVARDYVPNARMKELSDALFQRFDRLEDKFERCFKFNHRE